MTHDSSSYSYSIRTHSSRLTTHDSRWPRALKAAISFYFSAHAKAQAGWFPVCHSTEYSTLVIFIILCVCVVRTYDTGCRMPSALLLPSTKDDGGKTLGQGAVTFGIFGSPATACFSTSDPRVSYLRKIY